MRVDKDDTVFNFLNDRVKDSGQQKTVLKGAEKDFKITLLTGLKNIADQFTSKSIWANDVSNWCADLIRNSLEKIIKESGMQVKVLNTRIPLAKVSTDFASTIPTYVAVKSGVISSEKDIWEYPNMAELFSFCHQDINSEAEANQKLKDAWKGQENSRLVWWNDTFKRFEMQELKKADNVIDFKSTIIPKHHSVDSFCREHSIDKNTLIMPSPEPSRGPNPELEKLLHKDIKSASDALKKCEGYGKSCALLWEEPGNDKFSLQMLNLEKNQSYNVPVKKDASLESMVKYLESWGIKKENLIQPMPQPKTRREI